MIDFPANPVNGQIFTSGGQSWLWDSVKWVPNGSIATMVVPMNDNRIINGDCRIDQRNNGAAGTAINVYTADRWQYFAAQTARGTWQRQIVSAPGFPYALSFTSSSAYTPVAADYFAVGQYIEADMISDFVWGTANAQPVTLSFWVFSSLSGNFGGSITNYAGNRAYPFSFSIPTASTWTRIVINIPGDTTGTWVMSGNAGSLAIFFDLGSGANRRGPAGAWAATNYTGVTGSVSVVGTNGATFFVTGVKLEVGSIATPFNRQSLAKSMADCQRYYEASVTSPMWCGNITTSNAYVTIAQFMVIKRATPTVVLMDSGNNGFPAGLPSVDAASISGIQCRKTANVTGNAGYYQFAYTASAEL